MFKIPQIVGHPLKDCHVQSFAGPRVRPTQRFDDQQWLSEFDGPVNRPLQSKIEMSSSGGNHPIEDVIACRIHGLSIAGVNAIFGHSGKH
jgi:hypothetical protein